MADHQESDSQATGENTVNTTTNTGNDSSEDDDDIYEVEKIVGMTTSKVNEIDLTAEFADSKQRDL